MQKTTIYFLSNFPKKFSLLKASIVYLGYPWVMDAQTFELGIYRLFQSNVIISQELLFQNAVR